MVHKMGPRGGDYRQKGALGVGTVQNMAEGQNTIPGPSGDSIDWGICLVNTKYRYSIQNWLKSTWLPAYVDQYNLKYTCIIHVTILPLLVLLMIS